MTQSPPNLIRFVRRTAEGVQRPPIFEADDGHEYVLKLDTADADFPAAELVAANLALSLGVSLPAFRVLTASDVLIDLLQGTGDPDLAEFCESFKRGAGTAFGSRYLSGAPVKWHDRMRRTVDGADATLCRLLVFDAYIENGDRTSATNPNLLVSNGRLYAIDHGQSLPSVQGIGGKSFPYAFDSHLSWPIAQESANLLEDPIISVETLPDSAIDAAVSAVPASWWTAAGRADAVRNALRRRRDQLPATIRQLMERLR
jgi:hypothetical protein